MVDEYFFARAVRYVFASRSFAVDVRRAVSREPNIFAHTDWWAIYLGVLLHGNATHTHVRTFNPNLDQWPDRRHPKYTIKSMADSKIWSHRRSHFDRDHIGSLVFVEAC